MKLHLEVTSCRGLPPEQPEGLRVGSGVYTLGRSPESDFVLSDPERQVSSCHARIEVRDDGVWLTDQSTNGTFLNQSADRLPPGQPVPLHDGDTLTIGSYEVAVWIEADALGPPPEPLVLDEEALPGMGHPEAAPDIMDLLGGSGGQPAAHAQGQTGDPFADAHAMDAFLTGPASMDERPRPAESRPTPVEHVFFRPPQTQAIPDGYDLLSDELPAPTDTPVATPRPEPLPQPASLVAPRQSPPGEAGLPPGAVVDLSLDQGFPPGVTATTQQPEAELKRSAEPLPHPSETADAVTPRPPLAPRVQAQAEPSPGSMPRPTPTPPATDLLAAFLAGLGGVDASQVGDPASFLREAGTLLHAVTAGLTATMMARAHFKSELRLGVTTIRRAENNPFKFSVSPEEAIERLLLRQNPAFIPAPEAAREAFDDIQAHEMAMIAGLRAALRALLARFEPSVLEARLDPASGLDKLLPMARKSRYWDQFTQTYGQVAADAAEDFMQLFGEAFSRAYEDQILRLAQARGRRAS